MFASFEGHVYFINVLCKVILTVYVSVMYMYDGTACTYTYMSGF